MFFWSQELPSIKIVFQRFYFTLLQCFLAFCWLSNLLVIHTVWVVVLFFFSTLRDYTGVKKNSSKVSSHFRKVNECYKVNGVEEKTISPISAPKLYRKHFVSISRENQHSGHMIAPLILKRLMLICVLEPDDFCDFSLKQRKQQQGTSLSCRPSRHSTGFIWTKKCNCSQEVKERKVKLICMLSHCHILNLGLSPHLQFFKKS